MFFPSFLIFEKELPLTKEIINDFPSQKWNEILFVFFSPSLFSSGNYEVSENGFIYQRMDDGSLEKKEMTNEISFSTLLINEELDCYLSFKALFFKGELKEVNLNKVIKTDNKERKIREKVSLEILNKRIKRRGGSLYKIFSVYKKIVSFLFFILFKVYNFVGAILSKAERFFHFES